MGKFIKKIKNWRNVTVILLLLVSAFTFFISVPSVQAFTIKSGGVNNVGLVAYWTFDGGNIVNGAIIDRSGSGNNGTVFNIATSTFYSAGKIGQGLNFDGIDDYVESSSATFSAGDFSGSVCAWVNFKSVSVENTVISQGDTASLRGFGVFVGSTPGIISVAYYGAKNVNTNNIVSANKWNHICVTKSPGGIDTTTTIYLNGVSQTIASANAGTPDFLATNPVFIGVDRVSNGSSQSLANGVIDEVRFYNRAISSAEVLQLYNMGASTKTGVSLRTLIPNLVSWWTFDGGKLITNVADSSGVNNGSLIIGASGKNTSTTTVPGKIGQALSFDGTDDYIDIADNNSLSFGNGTTDTPMSISAWIYMKNAVEFKIMKKGGIVGSDLEYFFRTGDQGTNTNLLTFRVYDASANANLGRRYSVAMTQYENKWIFVTATYDGSGTEGGVALYINGSRVDDTSASSGTYVAMENLTTGAQIGRYNTFYSNGYIDDVRLYNKALSLSEIKQLYNMHNR